MGLLETAMTFRRVKLLSARIRADESNCFHVAFEHHRPDLTDAEYVWIVLQYIARVLLVHGTRDPFSAVVLQHAIGAALANVFDYQTDVFATADLDDVAGLSDLPPTHAAWVGRCSLYCVSATRRSAWIEFPRKGTTQQGVYSALAVLQASCGHLGTDGRRVLGAALREMLIEYGKAECRQLSSLVKVPRVAYLRAVMSEN